MHARLGPRRHGLLVLGTTLGLAGCFGSEGSGDDDGGVPPDPLVGYCGEDHAQVERRIDEAIASMTLAQKVEQMAGIDPLPSQSPPGVYRTAPLPDLQIPGYAMVDGPRGASKNTGNATAFPVAALRGATWDVALERRVGAAMATEARAKGASVLLAPTINILRHPRWGRAQETYSEDPHHMAELGVAFVQGVQEDRRVLASAKHFAVNSIEDTRFEVDVSVDERTLREIYLPHFRRVVQEAHVGSVMSAYNAVNGAPASENAPLLREILKDEWGFAGFVESDWLFATETTEGSALAGLDIEMPTAKVYGDALVDAVNAGDVPESAIDEAVRRILRGQWCYGLDTDPPVEDPTKVETPEHVALAREVAQRGLVLLKNDADALPIARESGTEVVLVGRLTDIENIGDDGSSAVTSSDVVTAFEGMDAARGPVMLTHHPLDADTTLDAAAEADVSGADVVVAVVGYTDEDEGEGLIAAGDRESMALRPDDVALIERLVALNDRVVVVIEAGAAVTMDGWLPDVEAVVMAWYPGMQGGEAIAALLFGDVNPSGRLPHAFPVAEGDLPPFDNESLDVTYGYFHGYRHLDRAEIAPLFPFGHGLAYTTYGYADLQIETEKVRPEDDVTVSVQVTNEGEVAGRETVQLYVSHPDSAVMRAERELRAFTQVDLDPGETKTVELAFPARDLAYWDAQAQSWVIEPVAYNVAVGHDSRDTPLEATFQVK